MQFRRSALFRNVTSIPLDKLEVHESDHKHRVDVETQVVNQALAIFPTPCYTYTTKYIPMQPYYTYFIRKSRNVF